MSEVLYCGSTRHYTYWRVCAGTYTNLYFWLVGGENFERTAMELGEVRVECNDRHVRVEDDWSVFVEDIWSKGVLEE